MVLASIESGGHLVKQSLKHSYVPAQLCSHLKFPFSNVNTRLAQNNFIQNTIDCKAIKSWINAQHQNCFSSNGITPKTT